MLRELVGKYDLACCTFEIDGPPVIEYGADGLTGPEDSPGTLERKE